jgi:ferredoxin
LRLDGAVRMARIRLIVDGRSAGVVPAGAAVSVLNNLLRAGIPIRHDCGGRARCGTCRIKVVEEEGRLSPIRPAEQARLIAVGADADERLACQAFASGDLSISVSPKP